MELGGVRTLVERRVIRRSWLTTVALVLIIAGGAGTTMAAAAGGRRAATSYDRLIQWADGTVASVPGSASGDSDTADANLARVAALPEVERSTRSLVIGDGVAVRGEVVPWPGLLPVALATTDPAFGRAKVLHGRLPDPSAANEAVVPFDTAERFDLRAGDTVDIRFDTWPDRPEYVAGVDTVTLVGIVAYPGQFPSVTAEPSAVVLLTPAFIDAHRERVDWTNADVQVKLRDSSAAGVEAFRAAVADTGIPADFVGSIYDDAVGVRKVVRVEAGVLWLVAAVIAGATVVVALQFLRREAADAGADLGVLRALGMSRSTIATTGALHGWVVGVMGALGAVAVSVAMSTLLPRGVARTADPDVGFHADFVVIGIGVALIVAVATAVGAGSAAWVTRPHRTTPSPNARLERFVSGLPTSAATGVRSALIPTASGPGSSLRIGLLGLGLILAALITVASMQASFDRVLADPAISGATWDMTAVWGDDTPVVTEEAVDALAADPAVVAFTRGGWTEIEVNGKGVYTAYFEPGNDVQVATDRGRPPIGSDEIALGRAEMEALDVSIGDRVDVAAPISDGSDPRSGNGETVSATVTGRAIIAAPIYQPLQPGEGGAVTVGLMERLLDEDPWTGAFITLTDDQPLSTASAGVADRTAPAFWFARPDRAGVRSLREVRQLPSVLLALLGLMAAAALVHRLLMGSRAARRDQAVLRSLGFTGRQFAQAGAAQGATVSVLALVGAIPFGLLCAAVGWRRIAEYLRVVPSPAVPVTVVAGVAVLVVALAVAAGIVLSGRARRARPGVVLRTE
jgi:putative ABC transport system permease protein